jgi:hypothetical protein
MPSEANEDKYQRIDELLVRVSDLDKRLHWRSIARQGRREEKLVSSQRHKNVSSRRRKKERKELPPQDPLSNFLSWSKGASLCAETYLIYLESLENDRS